MKLNKDWKAIQSQLVFGNQTYFCLDKVLSGIEQSSLEKLAPKIQAALKDMENLEAGGIANPDEKRQVGHYWLRNSNLAANPSIKEEIIDDQLAIKEFVKNVLTGEILDHNGSKFKHLLFIGIGGSALGPRLIASALVPKAKGLDFFCLDNTDPEGMGLVLDSIPDLASTLVVVASKSGGTKETRNIQKVVEAIWKKNGLLPEKSFVAITGKDSALDRYAKGQNWLARFRIWDWVGGRTSIFTAIGLLPLGLLGGDIDTFLVGAATMDLDTRDKNIHSNLAAQLAALWYLYGEGKGSRAMVVIPYRDRLALFGLYLQQLLMESLGKEKDLEGKIVQQGLLVLGNKGTSDQHSYIQQLLDGPDNFFAVFIEVLKASARAKKFECDQVLVENQLSSGDFLSSFLHGTRLALFEKGKKNICLSFQELNEFSLAALIALFERAVGLYASLININAYHQPGVEDTKLACTSILQIQEKVLAQIMSSQNPISADELVSNLGLEDQSYLVYNLLRHLSAKGLIQASPSESIEKTFYSATTAK